MRSVLALLKKELRQNAILYSVPAAAVCLCFLARIIAAPIWVGVWVDMMAVAVPVALAAAFGLQAFDLEENGRTRDFLLTKPLTPGRIIWVKYLAGLLMLVLLSCMWEYGLTPEAVQFPSFGDYSAFWFATYLLLLVVFYGICFGTGLLVKGPKKLLFGALCGALAVLWFVAFFFGLLAIVWFSFGLGGLPWVVIVLCLGLLALALLTGLVAFISRGVLANTPWRAGGRQGALYLAFICLLPLAAWGTSQLCRPFTTPFSSLFATFFGGEKWFAAVTAAKQPGGELYAFADAHGRLGLGKKGEKPEEVYASKDTSKPLRALSWSPDGRYLTFFDSGYIMMLMHKKGNPVVALMQGIDAMWSTDPRFVLLIAEGEAGEGHLLYRVDLQQRIAKIAGQLDIYGLAMAWDAADQRLLSFTPDWRLHLLSLDAKQRNTIALPRPNRASAAFAGRIFAPVKPGGAYRIAVFAYSRTALAARRPYSIFLYDVDIRRGTVSRAGVLSEKAYGDLIAEPGSSRLLVLIGQGVYRSIILPKEASS